jgi:hypothetical protein
VFAKLNAIHLGHPQLAEHEIEERAEGDELESFACTRNRGNVVRFAQCERELEPDAGLVLDDEKRRGTDIVGISG